MGEGQQRTVLVVDDEPSLRLLCRVNLEIEGYRVLEAGTVAEATETLGRESIDVVILDMHLGSESGLDVLDEIDAAELGTRVVVLSGTSEISSELRTRADDVLGKPFQLDDLAAAVSGERRVGGS